MEIRGFFLNHSERQLQTEGIWEFIELNPEVSISIIHLKKYSIFNKRGFPSWVFKRLRMATL